MGFHQPYLSSLLANFEAFEISCHAQKSEPLIKEVIFIFSLDYLSDIHHVKLVSRTSVEKKRKLKFCNFLRNQNFYTFVCFVMNQSPTVLDNLNEEDASGLFCGFYGKCSFLKVVFVNVFTVRLDYLSF